MQVVAIVAARNEERFITDCLEHLLRQGVQAYLIDNGSTDRTVTLAERFLGRGLVGIETLPHEGIYPWRAILERKEQIGAALDADWIMHVDADETPLPPAWASTLAAAYAGVEAQGYNAVNFVEFTFLPTREAPDHDHPDFQRTMRWYYPFIPAVPFLVRAWKRQPEPVELAWSGGHWVRFPGLRVCPESFPMRHYLFLSVPHAVEKYVERPYDPVEVAMGWHGWRARLTREMIELPMREELREHSSDRELDATNPRTTHYLDDLCAPAGPVYEALQSAEAAHGAAPGVELAGDSRAQPKGEHALRDQVTTLRAQVGALSARTLKQEETIRGLTERLAEAARQAETLLTERDASRDEVQALYGQVLALRDESRASSALVETLSACIRQHEETSRDLKDWLAQEGMRAEALQSEVERRDRVIGAMQATKLWWLGSRYWQARDGLKSIIAGSVWTRR